MKGNKEEDKKNGKEGSGGVRSARQAAVIH